MLGDFRSYREKRAFSGSAGISTLYFNSLSYELP